MDCEIKEIKIDVDNLELYRFRLISKYTLKELKNDIFSATSPRVFNDPYDCTSIFSKKRIRDHISNRLKNNNELIERLKVEAANKAEGEVVTYIYNLLKPTPSIEFFNGDIAIACLTSEINQEIMWSHYSAGSTGFAVKYDYKDIFERVKEYNYSVIEDYSKKQGLTLPVIESDTAIDDFFGLFVKVIYTNEKFDLTDVFIRWADYIFDDLVNGQRTNSAECLLKTVLDIKQDYFFYILKSIYCTKKPEWQYENEYRFIFLNFIQERFVKKCKVMPKAIYLGDKMPQKYKNKIIKIARRKDIKIYQMSSEIDIESETIRLVSKSVVW